MKALKERLGELAVYLLLAAVLWSAASQTLSAVRLGEMAVTLKILSETVAGHEVRIRAAEISIARHEGQVGGG